MDKNIKTLIEKYQFNRDIMVYSNEYYFKDDSEFRKIKSKKDVNRVRTYANNIINQYKNEVYPLYNDDIITVEQAIARYEIAVHKAMQCYGNFDFDYSSEELQQLVDNIYKFYNLLSDIKIKKIYQD